MAPGVEPATPPAVLAALRISFARQSGGSAPESNGADMAGDDFMKRLNRGLKAPQKYDKPGETDAMTAGARRRKRMKGGGRKRR